MKPFIFLIIIFSISTAFADSFHIVKNGQEYLCSSVSAPSPDALEACFSKAYSGIFSREESLSVCQGARSTAPADCLKRAYSGIFSRGEAIQLCRGTRSEKGPVECFNKVYSGAFSKAEAMEVCSGDATIGNADCLFKAYAGRYSKNEAIEICKAR